MSASRDFRGRLEALRGYLYPAAAVALSVAAAAIFLWIMYDGRSGATTAERDALLNTLLLGDAAAFLVTAVAAVLCMHLTSLFAGEARRSMSPEAFVLYFVVMLAPVAFIAGDIAWRPAMLADTETLIACGLSVVSFLSGTLFVGALAYLMQPREQVRALIGEIAEEYRSAGAAAPAGSASSLQPPMSGPSLELSGMLKRSLSAGDPGPVRFAVDRMAQIAMEAAQRRQDVKSEAAARGMVARIIDVGASAAAAGSESIVCHCIGQLQKIAVRSEHEQVSAAAFRGIGYTYGECMKFECSFNVSALEAWLAGVYVAVYDGTRRREALDRAAAAAGRAIDGHGTLTPEERARALYASGIVTRRLAEADRSEELALLAISRLDEAKTLASSGPLDAALASAEAGCAYAALAPLKNPIKSYKKALALFDEAGQTLTSAVSRYDAALLQSRQGYAHSMLADEYGRARRYDEALDSARTAIERYTAAAKYFRRDRSPGEHSAIMAGAGLAHALISEIYTHAREFDDAMKHANMAIDCYQSAMDSAGKERAPESYAALKVRIGVARVDLAEICFKEKRYDEAIAACDAAIADYNEAVRTYEAAGQEKQAAPARKRLKEASDLFNTFMMIGAGKPRQIELPETL